jgi:PleD family two-component response regulator
MPVMNRFQFLEQINSRYSAISSRITVMVLSSLLDNNDQDCAMELGANILSAKPLHPQSIDRILPGI